MPGKCSPHKRIFLTILLIIPVSFVYKFLNICKFQKGVESSEWNDNSRDPRFVKVFPDRETSQYDTKRILLWTPFFTGVVWDATHNVFQDCPVSKCVITTNRKLTSQSSAILFNTRDLTDIVTERLPSVRTSDQVWILHNTEPPYYIYLPLENYAGVFNWTSWYRRDATVHSPYGNWRRLTDKEHDMVHDNYFRQKTKMAAWVSSNCKDKSGRMEVVEELQKYIDIDTYGKCGKLQCKRNCREVFDDYKFFLSFENGYCRDYITEKFWRPLIRNQIPIVRGGADYITLALPGSYINVDDFPDIQTLATYLLKVASDESLYNSYFAWKRSFKLVPNGWTRMNWCGLCEKLHDKDQPAQVYADLHGWVQQDSCTLPCR